MSVPSDGVREVAISDEEPHLSYHDPSTLQTHLGVQIVTETTARAMGAVRCSSCYGSEMFAYTYPYLDDDR